MLTNDEILAIAVKRGSHGANYGQVAFYDAELMAFVNDIHTAIHNKALDDAAKTTWTCLTEYCKKNRMNPHHQNDLFAICGEIRALKIKEQ